MGNRVMKIVKQQTGGVAHGQEDWVYTIYARDATGNVIAVYDRRWSSAFTLGKPDAPIVVAVAETIGLGKDLIRVKVNGGFITDGPVLTASTPSGTAINFANAVNAYTGGEIDFTAEVDGEYIYLFTEASYEQPFEIEFLDDDPSFEHNEYFDYVPLKRIGIRPHGGSITEIPLHETVTLAELHIYGSSRLGIKTPGLPITKRQVGYMYTSNYGNSLYLNVLDSRDISLTNPAEGPFFEHNKGLKQYELSNHLGNVLIVFEDKKVSHESLTTSGEVGHYTASMLNVQDYYPFGWTIPGRKYSNSNKYRYGSQGQEGDDEIGREDAFSAYKYRFANNQTGKFWSVDPLAAKYPHNSSYAFSENRLIDSGELEGLEATNRTQSNLVLGPLDPSAFPRAVGSFFDWVVETYNYVANAPAPELPADGSNVICNCGGKDYTGFIRNATPLLERSDPLAASLQNISADLLNGFYPVGPADNLVSTAQNPNASGDDITLATIDFVLSGTGGKGSAAAKPKLTTSGGGTIRNSGLANTSHPSGVPFKPSGYPNFSNHLFNGGGKGSIAYIKYTGSRAQDFAAANKFAGHAVTPDGYTWHHTEFVGSDGVNVYGKFELVDKTKHFETGHSGGVQLYEEITGEKYK